MLHGHDTLLGTLYSTTQAKARPDIGQERRSREGLETDQDEGIFLPYLESLLATVIHGHEALLETLLSTIRAEARPDTGQERRIRAWEQTCIKTVSCHI